MDVTRLALALGLLALVAHVVKGLTGFGPAIVFVSVGSLIHDPVEVIVLAAVLDVVGGAYLSLLNPHFLRNGGYWAPMGVLMVVGAVVGGGVLSLFPPALFESVLGVAIVLISGWFLVGDTDPGGPADGTHDLGVADGLVGVFSGFCGGFTGMGGPPLIAYLGLKLEKEPFRAAIVPIFLLAALARVATYGSLGMVATGDIWLYVIPPVGVVVGNHVGNRFVDRVKQRWFTVVVGVVLLGSGARLLLT